MIPQVFVKHVLEHWSCGCICRFCFSMPTSHFTGVAHPFIPWAHTATTPQHRRLHHSTWRQLELHVSDLGLLNLQSTCHPMRRLSTTITMTSSTRRKRRQMGPVLDLYTSGRHSGVGITDIDDVADARDEFLNKTDPTADIKAFFKALPHVPGRPKSHMSCNLCA